MHGVYQAAPVLRNKTQIQKNPIGTGYGRRGSALCGMRKDEEARVWIPAKRQAVLWSTARENDASTLCACVCAFTVQEPMVENSDKRLDKTQQQL